MNIEKGKKYLCIKSVIMNGTGVVAFRQGKTYNAKNDGVLINEQYVPHIIGRAFASERFIEAEEEKIYFIRVGVKALSEEMAVDKLKAKLGNEREIIIED